MTQGHGCARCGKTLIYGVYCGTCKKIIKNEKKKGPKNRGPGRPW